MEKHVFVRGFYITDDLDCKIPFGTSLNWNRRLIANSVCIVYEAHTHIFISRGENNTAFLIGHAYNPVRMISDEEEIVSELCDANTHEQRIELINELTGLFLIGIFEDKELTLFGDPAGMQCVYYGFHKGHIHIASHTYMLEEVCQLKTTSYVSRLVNYRFYHLFGGQLPGDITPYQGFHRLIPNHCVHIGETTSVERFFPSMDYSEYSPEEIVKAVSEVAHLLHNSLELITQKWSRPAISMSGGCDSKTTLACAKGIYNQLSFFSYDSSDTEMVDAEAAHALCTELGLPHELYWISRSDSDFDEIESVREILRKNNGYIWEPNPNDVRKRAFFASRDDFDIEVKSWVSECGRAYYNKRFAKRRFPSIPTPHYLTTLYKVFFHDRKLVKDTDSIFKDYISTYLTKGMHGYPWQELFFWEFRMSAWNGLVITGEHRFSYDITIPYNNRKVIDMLLRMPLDDRIHDTAYRRIRMIMNPEIDKTGISVNNVKHTSNRAKLERLYLDVMSKI